MVYKDILFNIGESTFSFSLIQKERGKYRACTAEEAISSGSRNKFTLTKKQALVALAFNINDKHSIKIREAGKDRDESHINELEFHFKKFDSVYMIHLDFSSIEKIGPVAKNARWKFVFSIHNESGDEIASSKELWFNRTTKKRRLKKEPAAEKTVAEKVNTFSWHYNNHQDNEQQTKKSKRNPTLSRQSSSSCAVENPSIFSGNGPLPSGSKSMVVPVSYTHLRAHET